MQQTFIIIDGRRIEVEVKSFRGFSDLLDVTPIGGTWRKWIFAGPNKLELYGTTPDGEEIRGVFKVVDQLEDGTTVLEPWSGTPTVGGKE